MARSDTEEKNTTSVSFGPRNMDQEIDENSQDKQLNTTFSGHYMVSNLEEEETEDVSKVVEELKGYNFTDAAKDTQKDYQFGEKNPDTKEIDASLTKLFQCMTLAYRYR